MAVLRLSTAVDPITLPNSQLDSPLIWAIYAVITLAALGAAASVVTLTRRKFEPAWPRRNFAIVSLQSDVVLGSVIITVANRESRDIIVESIELVDARRGRDSFGFIRASVPDLPVSLRANGSTQITVAVSDLSDRSRRARSVRFRLWADSAEVPQSRAIALPPFDDPAS